MTDKPGDLDPPHPELPTQTAYLRPEDGRRTLSASSDRT